jgi:hypothetical protein
MCTWTKVLPAARSAAVQAFVPAFTPASCSAWCSISAARIVGRHDRRLGRVRRQHRRERARGRRAARQDREPIEEAAAVHAPVGGAVVEVDARLRDGHGVTPRVGPGRAGE